MSTSEGVIASRDLERPAVRTNFRVLRRGLRHGLLAHLRPARPASRAGSRRARARHVRRFPRGCKDDRRRRRESRRPLHNQGPRRRLGNSGPYLHCRRREAPHPSHPDQAGDLLSLAGACKCPFGGQNTSFRSPCPSPLSGLRLFGGSPSHRLRCIVLRSSFAHDAPFPRSPGPSLHG